MFITILLITLSTFICINEFYSHVLKQEYGSDGSMLMIQKKFKMIQTSSAVLIMTGEVTTPNPVSPLPYVDKHTMNYPSIVPQNIYS
jgi:hypothetical protein